MGRSSRKGAPTPAEENAVAPEPAAEADTSFQPLAKALANCDKNIRDKAVKSLRRWFAFRKDISRLDHMRMWKALFYCFWMSDKTPVQQELAENLSQLVHCFRKLPDAILFVRCFFDTMDREWIGLDRLRLDKFLSLIRKMFCQTLTLGLKNGWSEESVLGITDIVLAQVQRRTGIRRFVTEIFWDEIGRAAPSARGLPAHCFDELLSPFVSAVQFCVDTSYHKLVVETIFEPLLETSGCEGACATLRADAMSQLLFDMASDPDTAEKHREKLYALRKRFKKVAKAQEVAGTFVGMEMEEEAAEEAAEIVPEAAEVSPAKVAAVEGKKKKKKKRKKKKKKQQQIPSNERALLARALAEQQQEDADEGEQTLNIAQDGDESSSCTALSPPSTPRPSLLLTSCASDDDDDDAAAEEPSHMNGDSAPSTPATKKRKKGRKKGGKKSRKKQTALATPTQEQVKNRVHFKLKNNRGQTPAQARKSFRTPRPKTKSRPAPSSGILKVNVRHAGATPAARRGARTTSGKKRARAADYF